MSGEGTVTVNDGGAGIGFNFPGASRFRGIAWDEWFDNFETYELVFVYERHSPGQHAGARYRLVRMESLQSGPALR